MRCRSRARVVFPLDEGPEMPTITALSGSGGPGEDILWGPVALVRGGECGGEQNYGGVVVLMRAIVIVVVIVLLSGWLIAGISAKTVRIEEQESLRICEFGLWAFG